MIPINNSDTAWLITTDYLQDNGKHYLDLLEDIYCPSISDWVPEHVERQVGGGTEEDYEYHGADIVGSALCDISDYIGVSGERVGGNLWGSDKVGGTWIYDSN